MSRHVCRSNRAVARIRSPYASGALLPDVRDRIGRIARADESHTHQFKPPKLKLCPGATP